LIVRPPQIAPSRAFRTVLPTLQFVISLWPAARTTFAFRFVRHHARMAPPRNSANLRTAGSSIIRPGRGFFMSAATAPPQSRRQGHRPDRHRPMGVSHYYQLAFATMLLIVRQEAGFTYNRCRPADRHLLRRIRRLARRRGLCSRSFRRRAADLGRRACDHRLWALGLNLRCPFIRRPFAACRGDSRASATACSIPRISRSSIRRWKPGQARTRLTAFMASAARLVGRARAGDVLFSTACSAGFGAALIGAMPGPCCSRRWYGLHRADPRRPSRQGAHRRRPAGDHSDPQRSFLQPAILASA